jgi:glycerol kinase
MEYVLAIDQGTTGSRAFIFDSRGHVRATAYQEFKQYYPKPGWVEHDADEIWSSCARVIRKAIVRGRVDPKRIVALGITNQRETTILWDRVTGKPFYHAIVWQCRRTADLCAAPALRRRATFIRRATGLILDPYFSATKIRWLLDHVPGLKRKAARGDVCFGTVDSWLLWKLTNGKVHATDPTNASRTMLFDIHSQRWGPKLLDIFGIPPSVLSQVKPSGCVFGLTAGVAGLPAGIPITAIMGDQQAALYGQGCWEAGTIKNTYGTGCFMVLNTGKQPVRSSDGLLTTVACDALGKPVYALEGAVFIAGAVVQWLRDGLKIIPDSASSERLAAGVKDSGGVYFVPAFTGLGAPYWDPQARGTITGLTRGSTRAHIIRAALEAIAYQTKDIFTLMRKSLYCPIRRLRVDGGAAANDLLMQFQSDLLDIPVVRPKLLDSTAAGAAYLAGITVGLWRPKDIMAMQAVERIFRPAMPLKVAQAKYAGWQKALRQTMAHS